MLCESCKERKVCLVRPSDKSRLCKECFINIFEEEVHETIIKKKMFNNDDKICIGVSGGKDSSVLAHVLTALKKKYNYNWGLFFLAIDEGIKGYRDDSLKVVYKLQKNYNIPLKILKFEDIFSYTMDEIVKLIGKKNNCTVCGVFRRQALEKGALLLKSTKLVTGHNADDLAETVFMNFCRGDIEKLAKKMNGSNNILAKEKEVPITTCNKEFFIEEKEENTYCCQPKLHIRNNSNADLKQEEIKNELLNETYQIYEQDKKQQVIKKNTSIPRMKPLMLSYEKEIVLYAFHLQLDYFSTECIYSPNSFRGNLRSFIKEIEIINPQFILNIIYSSEFFVFDTNSQTRLKTQRDKKLKPCKNCGSYTSNDICKACIIIHGLTNYTDNSFLFFPFHEN